MVRIARASLGELARSYGGRVEGDARREVSRVAPVGEAGEGDLAPLTSARFMRAAAGAEQRGACILADAAFARGLRAPWVHESATWALAGILERADAPEIPARWGDACVLEEHVVLAPRVVLGVRGS